ncbi:metallopeptidase TldD-related protein [Halocatena marina]|nr:metallopeptidase TldD-related protein [Halocatena marina]
MDGFGDSLNAAEWVTSRLESEDVSHAEVGCVMKESTEGRVTLAELEPGTEHSQNAVWWRVFVEGSADYRFTTSLEESHLADLVGRSIQSARLLDQHTPARYDQGTTHQAMHPGWSVGGSLGNRRPSEKLDIVHSAFRDAMDGLSLERARASYHDARIQSALLTTTGTTARSTLERASVEIVVDPTNAPKMQRHFGSTAGMSFLNTLEKQFEEVASHARKNAEARCLRTPPDIDSPTEIVFGPRAAAELFHEVCHYLEIDMKYFGSSPFAVGDRIGPRSLQIEDGVCAGSWTARAFDAEGRTTTPVTLVSEGIVRNHLHDTASAIEEETVPAGTVVPSLGYERPPRIHSRHLSVTAGDTSRTSLRTGAAVRIESVESARLLNDATETKRQSSMPPSVQYAKDIAETTPSEFSDEATNQTLAFPIQIGYTIDGAERAQPFTDGTVIVSLSDIQSISMLGSRRETVTGTCTKHRSTVPYAITAPAIRLTARLSPE